MVTSLKLLFQGGARTRDFRGDVFDGAWSSFESQGCWSWNIVGRVITTQAVASAGQFMPVSKPGSSIDPRRLKTVRAVASAGQFVSVRKLGLSKGPWCSEIVQDVVSAGKFVAARSTRVE